VTALESLTWREADAHPPGSIALAVPLGATEQHGPHLPLSTDTDIAVELVARLARARPEVLAAPPVPYGSSGEHAAFAGTVSIGPEGLERLVVELCRSAGASFARILLVCAHGGNADPLARAVSSLAAEGRAVRSWMPAWRGDAHAGYIETSIMLALAPERVRPPLAEVGTVEPIADLMPRLREVGVRAVSSNGVLGDPTGASAAAGHQLLDRAEADLLATFDGWSR
jgi:creatinine amidohydrolase